MDDTIEMAWHYIQLISNIHWAMDCPFTKSREPDAHHWMEPNLQWLARGWIFVAVFFTYLQLDSDVNGKEEPYPIATMLAWRFNRTGRYDSKLARKKAFKAKLIAHFKLDLT